MKRVAVVWFLLMALISLAARAAPPALHAFSRGSMSIESVTEPFAEAVTVTSEIRWPTAQGDQPAALWLAGLAPAADAAPSAVALVWAKTSLGWFGEAWGLQLVSNAGALASTRSLERGVGALAGLDYVTLAGRGPTPGHRYEATLSYDPAHGALAARVRDLTAGETLYSGGLQLGAHNGPLFAGAGVVSARGTAAPPASSPPPGAIVDSLAAQPGFTPFGVHWGVAQPDAAGWGRVDHVDRRLATAAELVTPWSELPGRWAVELRQAGLPPVQVDAAARGATLRMPLPADAVGRLAAGYATLTLTYRDGADTTFFEQQQLEVGSVAAHIDNLEVQADGTVSGALRLDADGPLTGVKLSLNAQVAQQFFDRDQRGVPAFTAEPLQTQTVLAQTHDVSSSGRTIPFTFKLDGVPGDGRYVDATLDLQPKVDPPVEGVSVSADGAQASVTLGQPSFTIQPAVKHQTIDGFGASGGWWAQYLGGADRARDRIADLLFTRDKGIGLTQYRYNAGGGIDPTITDPWRTAETFGVAPGVYDWSRDANARWFLQAAKARGVRDFILFVTSPPLWLTRSGHTYNRDNLDSNLSPDNDAAFAQYLADIVKHFAAEGIAFGWVSPINEPEWKWEKPSQEGSPYNVAQILQLSKVLASTFAREGVAAKLLIPEAGDWKFVYADRDYADQIFSDPTLAKDAVLGVHSYWSTDAQRQLAGQKLAEYPGRTVWETEWCEMVGGRDAGIDSALTLAHTVYADLTLAGVSAWQHWLAVSRYDYRDGLIYTDYAQPGDPETVQPTKRLWALGNFSRYVRPGAVRVGVTTNYTQADAPYRASVLLTAFVDDKAGQLVVVAINQASRERSVELSLPTDRAQVVLTPHRTSEAEDLATLAPITLHGAAGARQASGTVVLAPQSVTTFVADWGVTGR